MSKSIYRWHRILSIIIAIPVLLWAASGFMHPIMSTVRPAVAMQQLPVTALNDSVIRIAPAEALRRQKIRQIHDMRLVHIGPNVFFQVQLQRGEVPIYLSTVDGQLLRNGDELYARHLARQFLEGSPNAGVSDSMSADGDASGHACCTSAARLVMKPSKGGAVSDLQRITAFNEEYDEIQRILPVYRVAFDRPDGIRIFVETTQDRFVHAVDDRRAGLDAVFGLFHTWDWAESLGAFRYILMALLLGISFLSALMGLWIFARTRTIRPKGNPRLRWRFNHRIVSVSASLFTLMFSFSGAYHALSKLTPDERGMFHVDNDISIDGLNAMPREMYLKGGIIPSGQSQAFSNDAQNAGLETIPAQLYGNPFDMARHHGVVPYNFSLVRMYDSIYWRVIALPAKAPSAPDNRPIWSKDRKMAMPAVHYFTADGLPVPGGERRYAAYLASVFGGLQAGDTLHVLGITKFEGEYGFVNKRLPVWKVTFNGQMNDRFYVETSTGQLSVRVADADLPEGYSFSFLHKHHFMDFGGKVARDLSTMFWAAMQIAMVVVGVVLYLKSRRK